MFRIEAGWATQMRQETLAEELFEKHRKKNRREQLLEEMGRIIPWVELAARVRLAGDAPLRRHWPGPANRCRTETALI